jgi:hypothetical protein
MALPQAPNDYPTFGPVAQQIQSRIRGLLAGAQVARERPHTPVSAPPANPWGEQLHQTVQHTEQALQNLGTNLWHQFNTGAGSEEIRSRIENAVNAQPAIRTASQNVTGS